MTVVGLVGLVGTAQLAVTELLVLAGCAVEAHVVGRYRTAFGRLESARFRQTG